MTTLTPDKNITVKSYPIRLRGRGQITIPQEVRDTLSVDEGDILTLLQVGEFILVSPKQPKVPQLTDRIATLMEQERVSLADLLAGLEEERKAMWQETRQGDA